MNNGYPDDDELIKLISETESGRMFKAPEYLVPEIKSKINESSRKIFLFYSIKIMAAAAAAIMLIIFMPDVSPAAFERQPSVLEDMNRNSYRLCEYINSITEKMIIKEDK